MAGAETCLSRDRALSERHLSPPSGNHPREDQAPMAATRPRPLSPHLTIWRWGPHMVVSILHRATGIALSIAGLALLTWWLMAIAQGQDSYAHFTKIATHPVGLIVLVGLTWAFFQHLL